MGYVGSLSVDAPNKSNGQEKVDWHFNLDQATVKQTVTQTYNVAVTDVHPDGTSSTITQAYSLTIGEPGNNSFVFKPGFGADTIVNAKSSDTIELDGFSSISSIDELQTLLHEAQTGQVQTLFQTANAGHDTVINLGNNDVITLENVHLADLHSSNFIIHVSDSGANAGAEIKESGEPLLFKGGDFEERYHGQSPLCLGSRASVSTIFSTSTNRLPRPSPSGSVSCFGDGAGVWTRMQGA